MDRAAHATVVIDFAAYRAARRATRTAVTGTEPGSGAAVSFDHDRLAKLRDLTPRQVSHRAKMLAHLAST